MLYFHIYNKIAKTLENAMAIVKLEQDENGELILPLDEKMCKELGWEIGDTILWNDNGDGSFTLTKKEPKSPQK